MRALIEELLVACLGWIPTRLGMAARLILWKPLFAACGTVRFGTGLTLQGCSSMRLGDRVRLGRGCHLYAAGGTLELGEESALSHGVTVQDRCFEVRCCRRIAEGKGA